MAEPTVHTRHRRDTSSTPHALWAAATGLRLSDTRALGRLVRWRIPDLRPGLTYGELFRTYPFTVLEEGEHHLIAGLCGRIWTLTRDYPKLEDAQAFAAWDEPGTVRVVFGHWVEPGANGGSALVSEARVKPTDRVSALRLRVLWRLIGPFERLVGDEAITTAARFSERSARG